MLKKLLVLIALGAIIPTLAKADPPPLSLQRGAAGVEAAAQWTKDVDRMDFVPSAWASYSIATNLSAFGRQGYNANLGRWEPVSLGLRMYVPQEPVRVALGVNYLHDLYIADHSYSVGLYAGWHLAGRVAASAAIEKDVPKNELRYRLALRGLVAGGK